jgi:phasin family protein
MTDQKIREFTAFGAGNLEAMTTSGKIWAAGVNDLTNQLASSAKSSFEGSVATFKALTSVKSVREAVEIQTTYSKTVLADAVATTKSLTDASIKLVEQAMAPLTARVAVAVESISKAA